MKTYPKGFAIVLGFNLCFAADLYRNRHHQIFGVLLGLVVLAYAADWLRKSLRDLLRKVPG